MNFQKRLVSSYSSLNEILYIEAIFHPNPFGKWIRNRSLQASYLVLLSLPLSSQNLFDQRRLGVLIPKAKASRRNRALCGSGLFVNVQEVSSDWKNWSWLEEDYIAARIDWFACGTTARQASNKAYWWLRWGYAQDFLCKWHHQYFPGGEIGTWEDVDCKANRFQ